MKMNMNDPGFVNVIADDLYRYQPFILSTIMGYSKDLSRKDLSELVNLYLLVWLFYREKGNVRTRKITEEQFARRENEFLTTVETYESAALDSDRIRFLVDHLEELSSKAIYAAVILDLNKNPALVKIDRESKGAVLTGLLVLIRCFDEIILSS